MSNIYTSLEELIEALDYDKLNKHTSLEELIEALDYDKLNKLHESENWADKSYEIEKMLYNGQIEDMIKTILIECTKYQVGH